jgi:hypothetical protein
MTDKEERTKDDLLDATGKRVDEYLNSQLKIVNEKGEEEDTGLDAWFQPNDCNGFRITKEKIKEIHGYTMGCKENLLDDKAFQALSKERQELISETDSLFLLQGTLENGDIVYTHWLQEGARFAQKVACDWWDNAESDILEEWGLDYSDFDEN